MNPRNFSTCFNIILSILGLLSSKSNAAEPSPRVVLLGDSITKGVRPGVTSDQTFGGRIASTLEARRFTPTIRNVGIGGERTDLALARLGAVLESNRPDVVLVMYGTNDSYIDVGKQASRLTVEQYQRNLGKLIDQIERAGARPVLMTPPRWADEAQANGLRENPNVRLEPYVKVVRSIAHERKLPLVDHYAAWSAARDRGVMLMSWTTDGCHPNPEGHRILAETILHELQPILTPKGREERR